MRPFLFLVIAALVSFAPGAFAGSCDALLTVGLHINIQIDIDPHTGQPHFRIIPDSAPPPAPIPAPPPVVQPRRQLPAYQPTSLGQTFHDLMARSAFIHQSDSRLDRRDLLVPHGGLCGSTCAINVLHAVAAYTGSNTRPFSTNSDFHIHRIIQSTWQRFGRDARLGITMEEVATALESMAPDFGLSIRTHVRTASHAGPITPEELAPSENEIVIVSVRQGRRVDGNPGFHALVLTGLNLERQVASYSDPNYPNSGQRTSARYVFGPNGVKTVQLGIPPSQTADIYEGCVDSYVRIRVTGR